MTSKTDKQIDKYKSIIRQTPFFSYLTEDEFCGIIDKTRIKQYDKSDVLLGQNDVNNFIHVIIIGKVKVFLITKEGKESILSILHAGEYFGEMSLIENKSTSATVVALEDTVTALIAKESFFPLAFSNTKVMDNLLQTLSLRIRDSNDTLLILTKTTVTDRIESLFKIMAEKHGTLTNDGILIETKLTHQEISEMVATTRETVTRIIDQWKKDNYIEIQKNKSILIKPQFVRKLFQK
ncbi:Crp/Fnr family transcriptional regulator [Candidatus Magnetoovum chiemensis]|nr:Crp/Fnr family transcriptional regulator [Candidatus Magnetoovum chiemensis]